MTVKFEKFEDNQGLLTFEISEEAIKEGLNKAYNKVKRSIQVPGFRKGKVPRQIFNNVYGEEALYEDTLNLTLPEAYEAALKEVDAEIVGQPQFDIETMEKGQPWVIKASVSLKPEVKLGDYKGIKVEEQDRSVTDEEVSERLEALRQDFKELVLKEDKAEEGDTVVIDFEGFHNDEPFEGGQANNHSLELGSGQFIPGFEEQLLGSKAGDEVEVEVTFPEDYQAEHLAGEDVLFKVKVHEVKAVELPELDDEFAKDADDEVESLDELTEKLRKQLEEAKAAQAQEMEEDEAIRQAVENADFIGGVPRAMIEEEIQRQMDYFLNNLQRQGITPDIYYNITNSTEEDLHARFEEDAEVRTKTNLVLEAIVDKEAIEVTDEERNEEVESLANQYQMKADEVRNFVSNDMLDSDIRIKKAMNIILDHIER